MANYESILRIEEIKRLMDEGRDEKAQQVLDTLDASRIKSVAELNLLVDVYKKNGRYEEAYDILLQIYDKNSTRRVLFQILEMCILLKNVESAKKFYQEYEEVATKDFYRYVFQYKIQKISGEPIEKQIATLEQLKKVEYIEEWAYELAKLYHKSGNKDKCIKECSDICLWFGQGVYVEKAKLLKLYYEDEIKKPSIIEELRSKAKKTSDM